MSEAPNQDEAPSVTNEDGFANVVSGMGVQGLDKRMGAMFVPGRKFDQTTLEWMFQFDDLIARIVELPVQEMFREWIEIAADADGKMMSALDSINARGALYDACLWARLAGGAVVIMGADDGQPASEPLIEERVKSFKWLTVLDRWEVRVAECYDDPLAEKYREPKLYEIVTSTERSRAEKVQTRVHESRVLRFDGAKTRRQPRDANQGWSDSIIQRIYEVVRDFSSAHASAAVLLTDFAPAVYGFKDLGAKLAQDGGDQKILKRIALMDQARSMYRLVLLDSAGESFERKATSVAGIPDLLDRIGQRLAAATGMPIPLLLGQSPGGLAATGEGDARNWYARVRAEWETKVRHPLGRIIRLLAIANGIKIGDEDTGEIAFQPRPLWQPSEKEVAETRLAVAQAMNLYIQNTTLDPSETAQSLFGGERYSMEVKLDTEARGLFADKGGTGDVAAPGAGPADNVQATALNGAQGTAMTEIIKSVMEGIPKESARWQLKSMFPLLPDENISGMLEPIVQGDAPEPPLETPEEVPTFGGAG